MPCMNQATERETNQREASSSPFRQRISAPFVAYFGADALPETLTLDIQQQQYVPEKIKNLKKRKRKQEAKPREKTSSTQGSFIDQENT